MKVRLTFELDDRTRAALAHVRKRKGLATRTQVVQEITETIEKRCEEARRQLRLHEFEPDASQKHFPGMEPESIVA